MSSYRMSYLLIFSALVISWWMLLGHPKNSGLTDNNKKKIGKVSTEVSSDKKVIKVNQRDNELKKQSVKLKPVESLDIKIDRLDRQEAKVDAELKSLGFPESLDSDHLSAEDRDQIYTLIIKKESIAQQRIHQIQMEISKAEVQ